MKKILFVALCLAALLLTQAGVTAAENNSTSGKILIIYFSHTGNTRAMASQIRELTGGDILEVVPVQPYPTNHKAVVDQALKETRAEYKPEIRTKIDNLEAYDIIFVGSPNWWNTIAPPVATLLSSYDFSGKTIIPFMTHEGTAMGRSESYIHKLCPNSKMLKGLPIRGRAVSQSKDEVQAWLQSLGVVK